MPWRLDPSKDNKTQSEKLPSFDELYCRSIDPLKEPGDLVAVLVFSPDQYYVGPPQIQTHHRPLGTRLLPDSKDNRVRSQFPAGHASFALHHRVLNYADAAKFDARPVAGVEEDVARLPDGGHGSPVQSW